MLPAVVREGNRTRLVGDVKYKLTGSGLAMVEDYYKLLTYATALRLKRGVLAYPQADEAPPTRVTVAGGGQHLTCHPLPLSGDWSKVSGSLDELAITVEKLGSG